MRDRRLNHRPEVISGVLAGECSEQLLAFFGTQRLDTDFVPGRAVR